MKYPCDDPFVRKHEHSFPLSVCAFERFGRAKSNIPVSNEDGNAIVDVDGIVEQKQEVLCKREDINYWKVIILEEAKAKATSECLQPLDLDRVFQG